MSGSFTRSDRFKGRVIEVALAAAVFSLLLLFVARYVRQERVIYFWDSAGYHNFYINLGQSFTRNPFSAVSSVFRSMRESDYNLLPTLFQMPFRLAFGPGRLAYILSIAVIFVFPSIVIFPYVMRTLSGIREELNARDEAGFTLSCILAFTFLPVLWGPVLFGSVDAGGLFIILLVLMLYFRADLVDHTFWSLVSTGLLLCALVLYRRWYAYWVVGFFGAVAISEGLKCAGNRERRAHYKVIVKNVLILGAVSFLSFALIAAPIAKKMLTTDYGDIYSAYRSSHPFLHNLAALYHHFGLLTILMAGFGIVLSARNEKRRPVVFFLCVQFAITFVLFARTQDFVISSRGQYVGVQHFYWALATVAVFLAFFVQDLFLRVESRAGKAAVLAVVVAASLANFSVTFLPRAGGVLRAFDFALPNARQYPAVRTDLDQVQALLSTLDDLSKDSSESTIYILASSFTLNSSVAQEGCLLLAPPHPALSQKIAQTNDVDKRDGFPVEFLRARYVVLTIPFGYHLAPQDQKVIGVLADQLVEGEGIGSSYEKLNYEFRLEDGSSAFIYRKTRPLDPAAVKALLDQFTEFYPENRGKFELSPATIRQVSAL
jgi:hypothetical protein